MIKSKIGEKNCEKKVENIVSLVLFWRLFTQNTQHKRRNSTLTNSIASNVTLVQCGVKKRYLYQVVCFLSAFV